MSYIYRSYHVYAQDVDSHVVTYVHATSFPNLPDMLAFMQMSGQSIGQTLYVNSLGRQPLSVTERWSAIGNYCGIEPNVTLYISFNGAPERQFHLWMELNQEYETDAHPSTWGVPPELCESLRV